MKTLKYFLIGLLTIAATNTNAQNWLTAGNFVVPGDFIGSTNDEFFDIRQNNVRRARFQNINWPGYNGSPALNNANRIHFPVGTNNQIPFSMMQLGYNIANDDLRRPWMNVGTTYGAGQDIMYVGILQSPAGTSGPLANSIIDAVVAWGCNDDVFFPGAGPDNLRFLFLAPTDETASPGSAPEGLETMRITPWGNVGIGSGFSNAQQPHRRAVVHQRTDSAQFRISYELDPDPVEGTHADFQVSPSGNLHLRPRHDNEHRTVALGFLPGEGESNPINSGPIQTTLDVGGITRVRNLPDTVPDCLITGFRAGVGGGNRDNFLTRLDFLEGEDADCFALGGDGTWVNICGLTGNDCRWIDVPGSSGQFNMYTGVNSGNNCDRGKVFIGTMVGKAKLHVQTFTSTDIVQNGIWSSIIDSPSHFSDPTIVTAVHGESQGEDITNTYIGVNGEASDELIGTGGKYNVGVRAKARNTEGGSIGVHAVASGSQSQNIGIYAQAPAGSGNYALWLNGNFTTTGSTITLSDEQLKTEITPLENASELLSQLQPKQYFFNHNVDPHIHLDTEQNYGFLAQEVQQVLPDVVRTVKMPPQLDSTGFETGTEQEYLGIQYIQLIPILVAALNEQNEIIETQTTELNTMEDALSAVQSELSSMKQALRQAVATFETAKRNMDDCCTKKPANSTGPGDHGKLELNQNYPNPFTTRTRIDFYLPEEARVRIEITDAQGRKLETLIEGQFANGEHSTTWDGTRHAPGIYYYSLYADGELLTKKMIKM